MKFRLVCFIPLFFLLPHFAFAQEIISGKIVETETNEPLAFATIIFNQDRALTVLSDIDGNFSYRTNTELKNFTVSYIGYETQTISIPKDQHFFEVKLASALNKLDEVVITAGENPANRIIRKVIANKAANNPENLNSFRYRSYNKTIFDIANKDSLELFRDSHLFIMESVTQRKYKKPDLSEETVLGTRVSGFKNPKFAALATEFQPFSFYEDIIKLYDIDYLNPISKGSPDKYQFRLIDTLFQKQDSVFVISYEPLPRKNFQGLKGLLYINSNRFAVQNVTASPAEKGKVNISIQQQYEFVKNQHWFPEQLNYELIFEGTEKKGDEVIVEGKSYIDSVHFDLSLKRKDFALQSVRLAENVNEKNEIFWEKHRRQSLDSIELKTYRVVDSIGQKYHFDRYLDVLAGLMEMKIPIGPVDMDLSKTFIYNAYEGFRLGTGVQTNEKISKNFTFGGFFGYGLKDHAWKYGGKIKWHPNNKFSLWASYANDLTETGMYGSETKNIFGPRRYIASRFDNTKQYSVGLDYRFFRYLEAKIGFHQSKTIPKYAYEFHSGNTVFTEYHNSKITLDLRFAYGEKTMEIFGQTVRGENQKYPVLTFSYTNGLKGIFQSDFSYQKFELGIEQSFYTRSFGTSRYKLKGGFVDNPVPYGLLFTGEGSWDEDFPVIMSDYFQTMRPYEFLSNEYASLFLSHDFGTLLFKTKIVQPRISVHQNIGWGELDQPEFHQMVDFKTMEEFFLESGIQIDNILKMNYLNIGYFGFGIAGFYRYGFYSFPQFEDNVALKGTVGFTIK